MIMKNNTVMRETISVEAVSYTHLDVYKRQLTVHYGTLFKKNPAERLLSHPRKQGTTTVAADFRFWNFLGL